jgi:hypothetical protein
VPIPQSVIEMIEKKSKEEKSLSTQLMFQYRGVEVKDSETDTNVQLQPVKHNYDIVRSLPPMVNQNPEIPIEMLESRRIVKTESFYDPEEDIEEKNEEQDTSLETTAEPLSEEIPMEEIPIHAIHPSENTSEKQSTPNETMPFTTTRSGRIVKPKQMFEASSATLQLYDILNIPMSEAMKTQPETAEESIIKELEQMIEKEVWTPIHPSKTKVKNIIPNKMFLKEKIEGALTFLKSRLVAGGHRQIRTIEDVVSSPTAVTTTIFIIALLAAMLLRVPWTLQGHILMLK